MAARSERLSVDDEAVADAIATLCGRGRCYVKSCDVARQMGLASSAAAHTAVGQALARMDDGTVDKWADPVSGVTTWHIVADTPEEVRS